MKKYLAFLLAIIMSFTPAVSVAATQKKLTDSYDKVSSGVYQDFSTADWVDEDGTEWLFDPDTNKHLPVYHAEAETKAITEKNEHDYEFERLFEEKRKTDIMQARLYIPGGVGYGAFFTPSFKNDFTTGTTLYYNIICPTTVGGDSDNYLYLTSMNRAAKCVEAFISYYKQDKLVFRVFDWARPESEHWQLAMTYDQLKDYLLTKNIEGVNRQCVSVQNRTEQTAPNQWRNRVLLKNNKTDIFEQVYTYTYKATLNEQKDTFGSWGPIVETFQDYYNKDTNVIGFSNINLKSSYTQGVWGEYELLTSNVSTIRNDNHGFNVLFLKPNYTFAVH